MSFKFDLFDRNQILDIVGEEKAALILELEECINEYHRKVLDIDPEAPLEPPKRQLIKELHRVSQCAENMMRAIGQCSDYTRQILNNESWRGANVTLREAFSILYCFQTEADWILENESDIVMMKQRGRPRNDNLEDLDSDVAYILDRYGIKVTKGREGKFARVLEIVRGAIKNPLAEDSLDAVRRAYAKMRIMKRPDSFDEYLKREKRYSLPLLLPNPKFW